MSPGGARVARVERLTAVAGALPRRVSNGITLVRQGEPTPGIWVVIRGAVRLSAVLRSGREVILGILGGGDIFGEAALLEDTTSPVDARAVATTDVLPVSLEALEAVFARRPSTATQVVTMLATRLHRTSAALEDALARDVAGRVSRAISDLASRHGLPEPHGVRVRLPVTQDEIGKMAGTSRESVNRTIATLSARGLVRTDRSGLIVHDVDALALAHEDDGVDKLGADEVSSPDGTVRALHVR
jgi:CRP/FNR family transcriptional regulator, cyclic AMP receptor protein